MNAKKINIWKILFWFALAVLAVFFHSDHFLNGDEGVTLNGAWNLYNITYFPALLAQGALIGKV